MTYTPEEKKIARKGVEDLLGIKPAEEPVEGSLFEIPPKTFELLSQIASDFNVAVSQMQGRARGKKPISMARQFAMWAICKILGDTSEQAALALGRERTTVIHAVGQVDELINDSADIIEYVGLLEDRFGPEKPEDDGEDLI